MKSGVFKRYYKTKSIRRRYYPQYNSDWATTDASKTECDWCNGATMISINMGKDTGTLVIGKLYVTYYVKFQNDVV